LTNHEKLIQVFQRGPQRIAMLTAYDTITARLAVAGGVQALLVGDSLGTTVQGKTSTHEVSLDQMVYHTEMVFRHSQGLPVIADLPKGTYDSADLAILNSQSLLEAGAWAVKFEGNPPGIASALNQAGIDFMGHLGYLPQSAQRFKVHGRDAAEAEELILQAKDLEAQGAFALVLECVPNDLAQRIQDSLSIPVIGIGAGAKTQGQILVIYDLLRLSPLEHLPRFVPQRYADGGKILTSIIQAWVSEVHQGSYPHEEETYG
jgi:3-methyl-2-oxobutanoate hydroxymethyltransferase